MATPTDGVQRTRRKSLVDIGRDMGVLSASQSLPSGFEEPIALPVEEIHLTPRSADISPRSTSPAIPSTTVDIDLEEPVPYTPTTSSSALNSPRSNKSQLEPIEEVEVPELGESAETPLAPSNEPPRESLFEPDAGLVAEEKRQSHSSPPPTFSQGHVPSLSTSFIDRHSSPYEDQPKASRFSRLAQTTSYSQTTPAPSTTKAPASSAMSFFSKLFSPITTVIEELTTPSPSNATATVRAQGRFQSRSNDTEASSSNEASSSASSKGHSRLSSDIPRSSSSLDHPATRPTSRGSSLRILAKIRLACHTLPPKSQQEEAKHREQYRAMMQAFEAKEAEMKQKNELRQKAKDARIMLARTIWTRDILPHWDKKKRTKPVHDLVLQGIPPFVRTRVWPLLLGNDLHISKELFTIYVKQAEAAKQQRETGNKVEQVGKLGTASLIGVDLPRTFPALAFYQEGGPNHAELHRVLDAYVCYRPDIGYVQGMSYLAAILLLYLDDFTAFSCLAALLNRNVHMSFYKMDVELQQYASLFETLFKRILPDLYGHFEQIGLSTEMYLLDWFLTIFSKSLPLDVATHLWDVYIFEGQCFLFRAALGILRYLQPRILGQDLDLVPCKQILARMPEDHLDEELLMGAIASINLREHESLLTQLSIPLFKL